MNPAPKAEEVVSQARPFPFPAPIAFSIGMQRRRYGTERVWLARLEGGRGWGEGRAWWHTGGKSLVTFGG